MASLIGSVMRESNGGQRKSIKGLCGVPFNERDCRKNEKKLRSEEAKRNGNGKKKDTICDRCRREAIKKTLKS